MNQPLRTTGSLRQPPLQFPAMNDRAECWDGLSERQQQDCRQALCQMLVAVIYHTRRAIDDRRESLDNTPEEFTHD
jgi:hypothetical protein